MRKLVVILWLFPFLSWAQEIGIGEWRYHIPFQEAISVADADDKVYCASELGMFYYQKSDNSINRFTKVHGLSDVGISAIGYNETTRKVVVGYQDGNLDLIEESAIVNMNDIARSGISGAKGINRVTMEGEKAFLSCEFGIVVLNLSKNEIEDTYTLSNGSSISVNDVTTQGGRIYAATEMGLYYADENNPFLNDPEQWTLETNLPDSSFSSLFVFRNELYTNYANTKFNSDTLYRLETNTWNPVPELFAMANRDFDIQAEKVVVCHNDKLVVYTDLWQAEQSFTTYGFVAPNMKRAVFDVNATGDIWCADEAKGLVKVNAQNQFETLSLLGPPSNRVHEIISHEDDIWIASGTVQGRKWQNTYNKDGVFRLRDDEWKTFSRNTISGIDSLFDFVSVAIDPEDEERVFFAAHGDGIAEIYNEEHSITYGHSNSGISLHELSTSSYRYAGMTSIRFDNNGILWGANYGAESILCAKEQDGTWHSFDLSTIMASRLTGRMITTQNNHVWVSFPSGNGIAVYDYNNTISDKNDDRKVALTSSNAGLPGNSVYALAEDLNGEVWVGTVEGVAVFRSPTSIFDGNPSNAEKVLIYQDGYTEYLLESQWVTSIAIDGANRKWMGTATAGVYLIAEDGTEELLHFTKENSPLMSNTIQTIGINHETGEVFFGTEQGVCSYKSSATSGNSDFSQAYAYPNPVEPNYHGDIAIIGLVSDSEIRITDISGNVVYQTVAHGGQAIWNGKTTNGERVKTGVYIVFCAAPDGSQSAATKILFIN